MRHLWSLLLALVVTPLIYIAAGISAVKLGEARDLSSTAGFGLLAAFVAGGLYALLVMARLSPVGPVVAGLLYVGVTLWALLDRSGFTDLVPADIAGQRGVLHVPVGMGTALLAAPLLLTVFSPRRWRSAADPAPAIADPNAGHPGADPGLAAGDPATAVPAYTAPHPAAPYPAAAYPAEPAYPTEVYPASAPAGFAPTFEPPVYTPPGSAATFIPQTYPAPLPATGLEPAGDDGERTGLR